VAYAVEKKSQKLEVNDLKTKVRRLEALPEYDETTPSRTVVVLNLPLERPTIEGSRCPHPRPHAPILDCRVEVSQKVIFQFEKEKYFKLNGHFTKTGTRTFFTYIGTEEKRIEL
jgi:hypothetical protein